MPWYDALLGRPADIIVNDDEVMWRICEGAWLDLVRDSNHAGHALGTVAVPDLDHAIAAFTKVGRELSVIQS